MAKSTVRNLAIVLGDQLNRNSLIFKDFDKQQDVVWMAEVEDEATHVTSHKARIVMFLAAMRHFRQRLVDDGFRIEYRRLDDDECRESLGQELEAAIVRLKPQRLVVVLPGEHRVKANLERVAKAQQIPLEVLEDVHFFSTPEQFRKHAAGRKQLRLEYFYRELRKQHNILMDSSKPVGGDWNYDKDNRGSFGKHGPAAMSAPISFPTDDVVGEVVKLVEEKFCEHPGSLVSFDWPVTSEQARLALDDFIANRLWNFGDYQDAMWEDEPFLYHSLLSAALNLKLLDPREVVAGAEQAYADGMAPLNAVEGFIRQILGWREYVRGIYWLYMPGYLKRNTLKASQNLPDFYWSGDTDMNCLSQVIGQTLEYGYAHHIQRLMVTGLFAMLLGVDPKQVHEWYLAVYVDAVEWVELPNSLGMSQFADDGVMASKPYCASGNYINRMSNYCKSCRYKHNQAIGEDACPFTTLYWDFLARHRETLTRNTRMSMQLRNLDRKDEAELQAIRYRAECIRTSLSW